MRRSPLWHDLRILQPLDISQCHITRYHTQYTLTRYVELRVVHAPGIPGTFSPPPRVSEPSMHQGTCVTHAPWCMPGSLTSGFLRSRWRGKRSRHSWRMHNPQVYVSGKRPITQYKFEGITSVTLWPHERHPYFALTGELWAYLVSY